MNVRWQGVFTALVTPFKEDGSLDEEGLRVLIRRQVKAGVDGLVPCGTTGESPSLDDAEWERVIRITVEEAQGRVVVAGSGTNNTRVSAMRTRRAGEFGADGALVITPYYNKPTPDGIIHHFEVVCKAAPKVPIMVYNVPGRTGVNLAPETAARLAEWPNVLAIKEASGNLAQVWDLVRRVSGKAVVFSGEDGLNLPIWDVGGMGTVSVLSNLVPELVVRQWRERTAGGGKRAYELHRKLEGLAGALFIETSPTPVKYALDLMGLPAGVVRPPLAPLRSESGQAVRAELERLELLRK